MGPTNIQTKWRKLRTKNQVLLCFLVLLVLVLLATPVTGTAPSARAATTNALQISATSIGVRLEWQGSVTHAANGEAQIAGWPLVEIGGAQVPAQLVALTTNTNTPAQLQVERVFSRAWVGTTAQSNAITPRTQRGEARAALAPALQAAYPDAPVVVLREGRMRGRQITVVAVSPLFQRDGLQAATSIAVSIPGATLLHDDAATLLGSSAAFVNAAPAPTNPAAASSAWTVRVAAAGIQRISAATLSAAGVNLSTIAQLHLRHAGVEVALQEQRSGTTLSELRFYALAPGDRWNAADTYWLAVEAAPGLRMTRRTVMPGSAPLRTTALERGTWYSHVVYDTLLPGLDGDHWFSDDLRTAPDLPPATSTVPLTPTLPLANGTMTLTITGSAYTSGAHQLLAAAGGTPALWSGTGNFTQTFTLANAAAATLTLTPGTTPDGIELDHIGWERLVALDFGGRGASFTAPAGAGRYGLANTAVDRTLYDVSDPLNPVALDLPAGTTTQFEDSVLQRSYVLTGPGTLQTPTLSVHAASDLATPPKVSVLYIAPATFQDALKPLIARRQAQGYNVKVVDVQAIYDAWSYGQVAPEAIRSFLRYAATSSPAPTTVVLVGDGTNDPFDDTHRGSDNINIIPPYLAMVDPYIGETACETCYAQLDEADPADPRSDHLPDLAIGRLPVKNVAQLKTLVGKIIGYETLVGGVDWRSRIAYIADNYREADGSADEAGDFAAFADQSVALQPKGVTIQRIYYDPWDKDANNQPLNDAGHYPNAINARQKTLAALNAGAGVINYVGHSHQWQWAVTGDPAPSDEQFLLNINDVDGLTNGARLPVLLEMTCLTSAFHLPAYGGSTLDEQLLLANVGGSAASWGSAGEGVARGHDMLQNGFYHALWQGSNKQIGILTMAGYLELFTKAQCCQDALQTYVLLGDPLTTVQAITAQQMYLPIIGRRK